MEWKDIHEMLICKSLEECGNDLFQGTIPLFHCTDRNTNIKGSQSWHYTQHYTPHNPEDLRFEKPKSPFKLSGFTNTHKANPNQRANRQVKLPSVTAQCGFGQIILL
jgi:hypothetical protein